MMEFNNSEGSINFHSGWWYTVDCSCQQYNLTNQHRKSLLYLGQVSFVGSTDI